MSAFSSCFMCCIGAQSILHPIRPLKDPLQLARIYTIAPFFGAILYIYTRILSFLLFISKRDHHPIQLCTSFSFSFRLFFIVGNTKTFLNHETSHTKTHCMTMDISTQSNLAYCLSDLLHWYYRWNERDHGTFDWRQHWADSFIDNVCSLSLTLLTTLGDIHTGR